MIIQESEAGSKPDNAETPDLLDETSQQLRISHPDDGHKDGDSKNGRAYPLQKRMSGMNKERVAQSA